MEKLLKSYKDLVSEGPENYSLVVREVLADSKSLVQKRTESEDLKAFELLYNEHYEALCRYSQRFVFDLDTSREIVQDVFISIWEKRRILLGGESLKPYLYRSVRNKCLDYLKHLKVKSEYEKMRIQEIQESSYNSFNTEDHPLDGLITKELKNAISSAIENLPPKCRKIFELSRYEGKKYREISEELNISVKTVETQMSRALKSIKQQLSGFIQQ